MTRKPIAFNRWHRAVTGFKVCGRCEGAKVDSAGRMCLCCAGLGKVATFAERKGAKPADEPSTLLEFAQALNPPGGGLGIDAPFALDGGVSDLDAPTAGKLETEEP